MSWRRWLHYHAVTAPEARASLFARGDRRAVWPWLSLPLVLGATTWGKALPWRPRSILDVGAHDGTVAEQLSQLYHPTFMGLVEPLPDLAARLAARRFAPRQRVFGCALGRQSGAATLNVLSWRASSSILDVTPESSDLLGLSLDSVGTVDVPVRTLDDVMSDCGLTNLDLLKVDVQGYELEVFGGGRETLRQTSLIVTEVSFFDHYRGQPRFGDVYEFLRDAGFELSEMFNFSYDQDGRPLQSDAVFVNLASPRPDVSISPRERV